ncbi:hypothetical protein RGQ29_025638 [Quercus rubra]|uniref:Uncharacterized protein n=1 Tax=Quercus rubra TaxID=3512 RepID=A0AAN7EZC9_QUERU|nr:hypothetical protein RGQ29_025638 [Quercus rubra]
MGSFVRITVLIWADILTNYALFVMTPYLTNVWSLNITHAAAIVNVFSGVATIMPIGMAFHVNAFMGDYWMLLLSSLAYSFGLSLLAMSTPPILSNAAGNCGAYKPDCIGDAQMVLFYTALAFLAIGISGHITSLDAFLKQQDSKEPMPWQAAGGFIVILLAIVGFIAIQFIKTWSVLFGMPAICTVVATFLFTTGSCSYKRSGPHPQGSPLTTIFRVFVASASIFFVIAYQMIIRCLKHIVSVSTFLHLTEFLESIMTSPMCPSKATIVVQTQNQEQKEQNRWRHCSSEEMEDTKNFICMIPMWINFIMCGVVISIGNTYFLEQANDMNRKLGKLKVPLPIFKFFYELVKDHFKRLYVKVTKKVIPERYVPTFGMIVAMLFSILCCIKAAEVETRRLDVIRMHGFLDKPNEKIPMSMFWLLPQFLLLGAVEGIHGVIGAGTVGSVLSVYVVGKVSERGGRPNWFQDTLNKSRLDNYYWTLTVLSAINLILYVLVAWWYTCRDPSEDANKATKNEESIQP